MGPALLPESLERLRRHRVRRRRSPGAARRRRCRPSGTGSRAARSPRWRSRSTRRSAAAAVGRGRDPRLARRPSPTRPAAEPAALRADPMNLFVVVEAATTTRRCSTATVRAIARFPTRYRAARRAEVHARRRFVYFALARRLDHQVRPLEPGHRGRGARRAQHAQRRGVGDGHWVIAGNYLPHTLALFDARISARQAVAGRDARGKPLARLGGLRRGAAQELRRRAEGRRRGVGDLVRPDGEPSTTASSTTTGWARGSPEPGFRCGARCSSSPRRLLLRPGLRPSDRRTRPGAKAVGPGGQPGRPPQDRRLDLPACRTSVRASRWHGTAARAGAPEPARRARRRHRHEDLEAGHGRSRRTGPGFFCAATRSTPYAWVDAMISPPRRTRCK